MYPVIANKKVLYRDSEAHYIISTLSHCIPFHFLAPEKSKPCIWKDSFEQKRKKVILWSFAYFYYDCGF